MGFAMFFFHFAALALIIAAATALIMAAASAAARWSMARWPDHSGLREKLLYLTVHYGE